MLDLQLDPGSLAFLQQGYRNNWQQYLSVLNGGEVSAPQWDLCILTASNVRQADAYEVQLEARRAAGLLPSRTRFLVMADPEGLRPGSGGATLSVLAELARQTPLPGRWLLQGRRILIIHSGGDSRRLPHCSATGKLFARVPHELPDGRPSSLFDEFLVSLSGLPGQIPEGVLVTSGDVLLLFDHLQLTFARPGVIGVAMSAPAETGTQHGVYVTAPSSRQVRAFLHKPSRQRLVLEDALDPRGRVAIDTGLVWFDCPAIERLLLLADDLAPLLSTGLTLNLYGDLLAPLAEEADQATYLLDASDGPATPALQTARQHLWDTFRGTPLSVEQLHPAAFIHFGTTHEYLRLLRDGVELFGSCGWHARAASWFPALHRGAGEGGLDARPGGSLIAVNACWREGEDADLCLLDTRLDASLRVQDDGSGTGLLLSHLLTEREALALRPGLVLEQLPLQADARGELGRSGYVTRLYGVSDDPKRASEEGGTYLNRPWPEWLQRAGVTVQDLWPHTPNPADRTLWNARLYPACPDREESLDAVLWLQAPDAAVPEQVARWRGAPRLSLAESYLRADVRQMVREAAEIEDAVRAHRFGDGLQRQQPAATLASLLGRPPEATHRARLIADWLEDSIDPWLPMRGYRALGVATGERRWDDRAFSSLARLVRAHTPSASSSIGLSHLLDLWALAGRPPDGLVHTARAAARIDFGGGWTDTPPYSLERGGTVLNAAITLHGELPILAEAALLPRDSADPPLLLASRDLEATLRPRYAAEVLGYANPADPFALLKAALVFRGLVPADTAPEAELASLLPAVQVRLYTATSIPRGSGLGTSSILAGAILQALAQLLGQELTPARLFDEVLCLEQMITTGGGWQDQIGGLVGGIKCITTAPGLPQRAHVEPVPLTPPLRAALDDRLLLLYTGQQRLAKDLLRAMMSRYMARDPEMVSLLGEIARLAREMFAALCAGELDALGQLVAQHWEVNKRMDPGCTNPFIDDLLAFCQPYWVGAKLAGAGGGGFALAIVRDAAAARALRLALAQRYPQDRVGLWPCGIAEPGPHLMGV